MQPIPLCGRPEDVEQGLSDLVSLIVEHPWVDRFYLDRTRDFLKVRERGDCDRFFALYATERPHDAVQVEHRLVLSFGRHAKRADAPFRAREDRFDLQTTYVYIALRMAMSGSSQERGG